jgi:hypothetical protein
MNRVIKAEVNLNEALKALRALLRMVAFLKFQNAGIAIVCGNYWLRKARTTLSYQMKREEMKQLM